MYMYLHIIAITYSLIFPAAQTAAKADVTIIVAGIDLSIEDESLDRDDLLLPGNQTQLINQVANAAKGPVVLVLFSAGGLDISFAKNNPKIGAILWIGYPGERGGPAIADVIFGKYNPVKSKQIKLIKFQHCYGIKYGNDSHNPTCSSIRIDDMDCKDHKIEFEVEVQNTDYDAYTVLPSGGHTIPIGDDIVSFPLDVNFSS
ncbi:hypothetical protein Tsubulata_046317 [Turnera subulata]|uniref:Glycoside hydrolase family 3 C-terminal domain-containing protein n=1 Tax=Turnera subulata TaxID=218843 RepID=A0A9Q0JQT8_9ROSI|nr:hypothetical protein Tsubulata_046317 [Turnera subulata]